MLPAGPAAVSPAASSAVMFDSVLPAGPPPPRLDYANLRMAAPESVQRGMLIPAASDPRTRDLEMALATKAQQLATLRAANSWATANSPSRAISRRRPINGTPSSSVATEGIDSEDS